MATRAATEFQTVFTRLRDILRPFEAKLALATDGPTGYTLNSRKPHRNRDLFFAGVRVGRAYVSYYLFPIYMAPELGKGMSPALKKRMQGKSCFNFSRVDEPLFAELAALTRKGFDAWRKDGLV